MPQSVDIAVIGGGPAGLMAADAAAAAGRRVILFERMPSVGRKLLIAGRGGLNLTHSEPLERFLTRYGAARPRLEAAIRAFSPDDLRAFAEALGQPTFVGSSGRVFPVAMKASPFLRAWLRRLDRLGVRIVTRARWTGWTADGALAIETPDGAVRLTPHATVLALGGASWPRLGSDGAWVPLLERAGLAVTPLAPANAGLVIDWTAALKARVAGKPLKRIALSIGGERARGEAVITAGGLEGGAVYALGPAIRAALAGGPARLMLDLKPDMSMDALASRLARQRPGLSLGRRLGRIGLADAAVAVLRDATDNRPPGEAGALAALIKAVPLTATGFQAIDRAISTAGGVAFGNLDDQAMARARPGLFLAGEMLDWEAPTGGYLLQAAFATGRAAGLAAAAHAAPDPVQQRQAAFGDDA